MTATQTSFQSTLRPSAQPNGSEPPGIGHVNELSGIGHVSELSGAMHLSSLEVELVLKTSSGIEYSIPLDKLTPAQKTKLNSLMAMAQGRARNIHDEMNPARGQPSSQALELAELARIAIGHPISFQKGHQLFIVNGSFLRNYTVDDQFRDRVLSKPDLTNIPAKKTLIHNQYNCGKRLLEFTRKKLETQKEKLQNQLDATPPEQLQIKSTLKHRIENLEKTIEFYDSSNPRNLSPIKENVILTAALFPLDLTGLNDSQIKDKLEEQKNQIKEALDSHVVHGRVPIGSDLWNRSNPNYEPRSEREAISSLLPFGASSRSAFDAVREGLAADIAEVGLVRTNDLHNQYSHYGNGKNSTPESFFIELQQLAATGASDADIHTAIFGRNSYLAKAFPTLHQDDRAELANSIFTATTNLRNIAQTTQVANNADAAAFRQAFDTEFKRQLQTPNP